MSYYSDNSSDAATPWAALKQPELGMSGSALGSFTVAQSPPSSEIERVISQIHLQIGGVRETTERLRRHADALFGEGPEATNECVARPTRGGALGRLWDTLDILSAAHKELVVEAERNCQLG